MATEKELESPLDFQDAERINGDEMDQNINRPNANRKFWTLYIIACIGIIGAYYGGYRMGRYHENKEWQDIVNPKIVKQRMERS